MPTSNQVSVSYSDRVLEETPERATKFLAGIGSSAAVRTVLAAAGMTAADIQEGADLMMTCILSPVVVKAIMDTDSARAQREAIASLDQDDEPVFARLAATLRRHYPGACEFLFQNLEPSRGPLAVKGWATLLGRIIALEQGTDKTRTATRDADREAIAFLAKRGMGPEDRARYSSLVHVALGPTEALPGNPTASVDEETHRQQLLALKLWYEEWSTAARTVIKKRADLIRLGLAYRKSSESGSNPGEDAQPSPVNPS